MATKKKDTAPVSVLRAEQLQTKPKETAKKNTAPVSVLRAEQLLPAPKTEASAQRAQEALGIPYSAQRAAGYMAPAKSSIFSDTQREIFENATAFQKSFGTLDNFLQNKRTTKRGFFSRPEPTLGQSTAYHNAVLWDGAMQYQQKRVQDLAAQVSVLSTAGPNVDRTGIYRDYVQAVNNYRSMIPQYNRAIDTYNGMAQAAKKLNEDWRKSIRSTDEIDKDVAALRQEIAAKWNERQTHAAQLTSNPDRLLPSALETRRKNEQAMVDRYDREIANLRKDEELLQEERFWSVFYQYEDNRNDPDFLNKATPKHQAIKGTLGEEAVWRAVNSDKEIGKNDTAARMIMGALAPVSNLVGPDLAPRVMSDDEKQMFNYLWNEKSATEAVDYFKALKEDHLGRWARGEEEKYIREMAKNPLFGWKMSDLSVLMGPGKALGFLAQGIDYALDGTINENAAYNRNTYAQRAIRDERADFYAKLAETKLGEGWGKLGSFGYQTAMSMADFIFNAAITGNFSVAPGTQAAKLAERLSLGIMSTGAAADATVEAKDRGLSDGQAIVLGTVAGFAEYITEMVSLETLLNRIGVESGWWYLTKNFLAEGSEEVASDLINLGADIWISQDKAEWQRAIRAYENQGLDKRAAFQKAWNDQARGMLLSFAGGAISGGVMAGGRLVQNRIAYDQTLRDTGAADERVRQLVEAGKAQPEDTRAFKAAEELSRKLESGESVNMKDAMRAANAINRAIDRGLRSGLAENIGRNLLTEQMRPVIEESVDYLLSTKRSSQTYKLGQQLLNKLTNGENITAQEAGEAFLQAEKVASGDIGIRMERDLKPREVTAEMDELERSAAVIGVPEREVQNVKRIADALGRKVLYESVAPENGRVQNGRLLTDGTIMINARGVDPYIQVFSHELTHDLEGTDAYEALSKLILSRIENIDEERERLGKLYKDGNDIDRELVAFYVQENLLQNEKAINEVVSRNRNFGRWMLDKIDDLLAKLGNENAKERAFLRKARQLYVKALQEKGTKRDGEAASYTEYDNYSEDELRNLFDSTTDERLNASRAVGEFEDSEEYKRFFESVLGQKDGAVDEFNRWADESGYAKAFDKLREAERRLPEIRRKLDERIDQRLAREEMDKVKASGKTEAEYFRQAAVREFGYTPFFYDAGYILPNGKMLNFSGEKGKHYGVRGEDHRGIGRIYESTQGSAAMNRFMKDGNIRIMAESPGLDICNTVEPTKEQYATIRRFVNESRGEEYFSIDFSDERGNNIGSIEYEGRIYTDRVINDIKHFFATGEVREQSTLDRFRYSYSETAETDETDRAYLDALNKGDMETAQKMVDAAAKKAGYDSQKLYSGTDAFGFTQIDTTAPGADGFSFWATNRKDTAGTYTDFGRVREISDEISWDEIDEALEETSEEMDDAISEFRNLIDRTFSEWFFGQTGNKEIRETIDQANEKEGYGDGVYDVLLDYVAEAYIGFKEYLSDPQEDFATWQENSKDWEKLEEAIIEIEAIKRKLSKYERGEVTGGIYQFYANTDNMYTLDAMGAVWSNLHPEGLPKIERGTFKDVPYRTRDVAKWAKDNGYDGVIFKNIRDNGSYGRTGAADVYAFFKPNAQVKSADPVTYDDDGEVIPLSERFNPEKEDIRYSYAEEEDSQGRKLSENQAKFFENSKARDEQGRLLTLYHQTENDFTVFDPRHEGAGTRDNQTPYGIFLKSNTRDIGVRGKKQMALYANITNPLVVENRTALEGRLREMSPEYADLSDQHRRLDSEYQKRFDKAQKKFRDFLTAWRAEHPNAGRTDVYETEGFESAFGAADEVLEEWEAAARELETKTKNVITQVLEDQGYDGLFLQKDQGAWGRSTDAVVALRPEQVKNIDNQNPTKDPDIRYSFTEEPKGLELPSVDGGRVAPAGAQETDGRLSLPMIEVEETEETKEPKTRKKPPKPVAESKPILARNWLNRQIMDQFAIRENKTEASKIIQQYADKVLREGTVTDVDVGNLFGQLYDRGVFEIFPDSYSKAMRELVTQGNIYTPESVKAEFGDDWADFRRKAFDAGLMLTNTRSISNAKTLGVDQIYKELSDMSPGLFPVDEYDQRTMLEKIVQAAENGKSQKMTLPEYLDYMNKTEGQDMFEAAENMMDKIAEDMRAFGEMAGLEIKLRDRTGVKIAQERARFGEIREKQFQRISDARVQERERFREIQQRARERKQISELQQKTLKQLQWLSKNRYRAPEELRGTWDELLGDMDIYAVHAADEMHYSQKHDATYRDLIKMYKEARATDPNFLPSKELERIMSRVDGEHLEDLDVDSLKNLYQAITGLRTEFYNRNNAIMENETAALGDIFDETRRDMTMQSGYRDKAISRILNEESLTPMNVLRRMVGWNKNSAWVQLAKQLEKGEKVRRDYKVRAERLLEDYLNENKDWFTKADGIGKDAIWYEVKVPEFMEFGEGNKPIFGDTVSVWMTPLQKVHMYLESKNYDNLRHMLGGRTFADKDLYSQGERARAFADGRTIKLAPETVKYLVKDLSPEEMKLAKILENYYNVWSKGRINEVSNKLYGYDKAMNANYAPILTNQNYVGKELGVGDATAAGVGNLKGRIHSKNPSYNVSAIEAFERNLDQDSKFIGLAIAENNWQKLLNWQAKGSSMRDVITHTWDKRGLDYIEDLIETLQGRHPRDGILVLGESTNKLLSNYISAVFGSNPGIVFKQAASYPQFAAVLGWSTVPNPKQFFKIDTDLINTYTSELAYRQMGYATPETAQLKNNPGILQKNKTMNLLFGGGAITAMDAATVKRGWAWAENAVKRDFPDLDKGTEAQIKAGKSEYYKKVAEYFEDAVSTTQPMYDEMHRPYIMKEAKGVARAFTMFKTVPMQQYNTLRRMWGEYDFARKQYQADSSAENKEQLRQAARGAANAVTATVGSVVALELVELLNQLWKNRAKGYRDDDDELTAASIGETAAIKSVEDFAGMVPAGKEIAQILENLFMGKKWYGIEIPGGEQLNDFIETVQGTYKQIAGFVSGSIDVISNGEDWGLFLKRHAREYAGAVKDLAQKTAMYFDGLPLENLEKYIMGAVQFSPELTAAVEDVFKNPGKSDLKGLRGHMLRRKIEDVMTIRGVELSKMASDYLSTKYQNGVNVIPTDTPKEITVDGEPVKLTESQKLKYERAWAEAGQDINTLITSRDFQQADEATQQRMIGRLYAYATEEAKKAALGSYEQDTVAARAQAVIRAGGTAAQWAMLDATTNFQGAKDVDAYDAIARSSAPESVKRAMFGAIKGTEMTTESGEPTAYAKMQTVTAAGMTVSAYARWLAESGDKKTAEKIDLLKQFGYSDQIKRAIIETMSTDKQQEKMQQIVGSGVSVDGYLDIRANGAEDEYIKLLKNGIKGEKAAQTAILAQQIKDEAGPGATDLEKLRIAIDRSRSTKEQMDALTAILTTDQCRPYVVGNKMGVTPDIMVTAKEKMRDYDADQNGSYKNDEVTAMIEGVYGSGGKLKLPGSGNLSNDQKAVLWQLLTGSSSAKNNPYSVEIGNQVLAAKAAQKETDGKLKLPG